MNRRLAIRQSRVECEVAGEWYGKERLPAVVGQPESWLARRNGGEFECERSSLLSASAEFDISARVGMRNERCKPAGP
jgi:hypothetical protein